VSLDQTQFSYSHREKLAERQMREFVDKQKSPESHKEIQGLRS